MYNDYVEALQIDYDPVLLSYPTLLDAYFSYDGGIRFPRSSTHQQKRKRAASPLATSQRCRPKRQYAPVIFTHDKAQRAAAETAIANVEERYGEIATVVEDLYQASGTSFWDAEPYHQKWKLQKRRELMLALELPTESALLGRAATILNAFAGGAIDAAMTRRRLKLLVNQGQLEDGVFEAVGAELQAKAARAPGAWKR